MRKFFFVYIIFAILVSLLWTVLASESTPYSETWLSLDYFLNYMSRVPTVNLQDLSIQIFYIENEWLSIFDWLRNLINLFGYQLGLLRWLGVAVYNLIVIVLYFVKFFIDSTFGFSNTPITGDGLIPNGGAPGSGGSPGGSSGGGFGGGGGGSW